MDDLAQRIQGHVGSAYHLEHELGGGGMSRLFVARDTALGRQVVIKVLPRTLAHEVSMERFRREIMLAAGLQHPQIVPVLHADDADGIPFFVMPYIEGKSLRARIGRGPLSVRETVAILRDVARALDYAHRHGVIHRDIKPDNVLLAAESAVVTDFGVAKAISASLAPGGSAARGLTTGTGISMGTPAYMAPEQAAADPNVDARADLYSLGIVGWEMLVGTPPFGGRSPQAQLVAQLTEVPPNVSTRRYGVPAALSALIAHCVEKDPARRPASAGKVLQALDDPEITSGAFASPEEISRRAQRRWPRAVLYAAGVAAAVVVGWMLGRTRRLPDAPASQPAAALAPAPLSRPRSIAILPLLTPDGDRVAAGFAEGLESALRNALSTVPGLRVASRTTTGATSAGATTPADVARALNTTLLLEGNAQTDRGRVRTTIRLVDVAADSTIWSDRYERRVSDLFAAEDSVTQAIMAEIRPKVASP